MAQIRCIFLDRCGVLVVRTCHFPPFKVARVTTFAVACKAYGGEAFVPLFRAFLTVGPASDWLTFQKRHRSNIPLLFGNSMSNIPSWKSDFIFVKETLISSLRPDLITDFRHEMAFRNFMKKLDQYLSFFVRPADQSVDVGSPSVEPLRSIVDNDQAESCSLSKDKDVSGFELAVVGEGIPGKSVSVVGVGSKRRFSITKSLE
ncbi:hypothetical protein Tco_0438804 [Tanacetum coccineum]